MTRHGRRRSARRALHYLFKAKIAMAKKSGFSADFLKRQLKRMSENISRRKTPWVDQTIASGYQLTRLRKIGCRKVRCLSATVGAFGDVTDKNLRVEPFSRFRSFPMI
jgi:hypothetical protein